MTVKDFVIPLDKDDLLKNHAGQYSVNEVFPIRAINQALDSEFDNVYLFKIYLFI